ncbi:hypothetical protein EZV62_017487 [Acer yangbiense]|uniref:Cytochrome P450 n=1 Tax=Acer yangbiense TaxID=1000413 RepID=A0A5C7HGS7_9ROSI|nr:hypothetical protein EZV62_017487 [Acer yangbiense]
MGLYILPIWVPLLLLQIPLLLLLKKIKEAKTLNRQLPPSPPKLPILGNLHQLGVLPHQSFRKLYQIYGPVMLFKFGRLPVVVISSAEAANEVLKVHDLDSCSRPSFTGVRKLSYNCSDLSFSPYGDYWREIRKICVLQLFSLNRVQSFQTIREEEIASLLNSISQSSSSVTPVDLSEKIYALAGSIILRIAFGQRFPGSVLDHDKFSELIHDAEALLGSLTADEMFPYVGWIIDKLTGYHTKLERVFHELDMFYEQAIGDHLKAERETNDEEDIIDVMLKIVRNKKTSEARFTEVHIKAILMDIFLAGVDTSAKTVVWAMAELARNPRAMNKAQDEVRNFFRKKGKVSEDDIDQLHYLKLIIKETLRLHPAVPLLLPRETISHFKVNGYDIYPKTIMQVNVWAIGRDPNYWKDPEEFYPERFMDNPTDFKGQNFEFLPFGSGRRSCPGINMGLKTVEVALANLLYEFNWKLPNGMKEEDINMEEAIGMSLTVSKKTALNLVPVKYL